MSDLGLGSSIIAVAAVMQAIATTCVGLRLWSLSLSARKLFVHDLLILIGYTLCTALATVIICAVIYGGLGRHAADLIDTPWMLVNFGKITLAAQALWGLSMTAVRLSIVSLYSHLFSTRKRFQKVCYAVMGVCFLWYLGYTLTVFLNCRPLSFLWDKANTDGQCGDLNKAYLGTQASNLILDLFVTLLPVPALWGLQMPNWRKISIAMMFSLGLIICAISAARISSYQLALQYDQTDFTWTGSKLWIFTVVEPLLACSLACMPLIRPVMDKLLSTYFVSKCRSILGTSKQESSTELSLRNRQPSGEAALRSVKGGRQMEWNRLSDRDSLHSVRDSPASR